MSINVKTTCNWSQTAGNDLDKAVPTRCHSDDDVFEKPVLNDILNEDSAVLFSRPPGCTDACELQIRIFPRFKIAAVSLICSAPKVELFLGTHKEYLETLHGQNAETDGNEDDMPQPYRYDIEIERSGVVDVSLKLLSPNDEICIFGIILHVAPNPNGITTLLPKSVNLENVQDILKGSSQKISEKAEKCKQFMEMYKNSAPYWTNSDIGAKTEKSLDSSETACIDYTIKAHIDSKIGDLERNIMKRLEDFEATQSIKLEKIMKLLENKI